MAESSSMPRVVELKVLHRGIHANRKTISTAIGVLDMFAERFNGGCPPGELSIVILTDIALAKIHSEFLNDPSTTDVITFEGEPSFDTAGEICISADTAASFASTHKCAFSEELTLYLVHGWLHLAGYDDLEPKLKRSMRRAEKRAMKLLAERGLLNGFKRKSQPRTPGTGD